MENFGKVGGHKANNPIFSNFFAIFSVTFFRSLLGPIFDRFWVPSWGPKLTKIEQKSMPKCIPFSIPFFDRFLVDFGTQLRPPETKKSLIFHRFSYSFWKNRSSKLISIFDPVFAPTWLHFGSQNPPKSLQKPIPKTIKILIDF